MSNEDFVKLDLDGMFEDERKFGRRKKAERIKIAAGTSKVLRILRGKTDTKFYTVRKQHWGVPAGSSGPPLSCANAHGDTECYFCDLVSEYYNSGDPRKKAQASRMRASASVMSNVIDVQDPINEDGSPKVQLWQYTWAVFMDLMRYFKDSDYGDVTNPVSGRNFKVSAERVSDGPSSFIKYKVTPGANPSALEHMEALDHLHNLDEIYPPRLFTYTDQKLIAEGEFDPRKGELPSSPDVSQLTQGEPQKVEEEFEDAPQATTSPAEEFFEDPPEDSPQTSDSWENDFEEESSTEDASDDHKRDDVKKKLEELKKVVAGNRK